METILKVAGGLLGLLVPYLFYITLNNGMNKSPIEGHRKIKYKGILGAVVILATLSVWLFSVARVLDYHSGDVIPKFTIPLVVFVLAGILCLANKRSQTVLSFTPLSTLVGVQAFRLAGIAFFFIAYLQILPETFQWAAFGDLLTGTLAILASKALQNGSSNARVLFWLFNIVGLLDLLNVAFLLLLYYPIWNDTLPTSESATQFSLVMIPAIAAPFAILLHLYSIIAAIKASKAERI